MTELKLEILKRLDEGASISQILKEFNLDCDNNPTMGSPPIAVKYKKVVEHLLSERSIKEQFLKENKDLEKKIKTLEADHVRMQEDLSTAERAQRTNGIFVLPH